MSFTEDIISNVKSNTPVIKKYPNLKKIYVCQFVQYLKPTCLGFFPSTTWVLAKYYGKENGIIGITI